MLKYPKLLLDYPDPASWTIPHVLRTSAQRHPEKVFLYDDGPRQGRYTYRETLRIAEAVAGGLAERGFRKGDRLGLLLDNSPELIFAWLGSSLIGVPEVALNVHYVGAFLEHAINLTSPRAIVTSPRFVETLNRSRERLPADLAFFVTRDADPADDSEREVPTAIAALSGHGWTAEGFDSILATKPGQIGEDITRDDLAALLFTSGTTGPSKAVMMPHSQMVFVSQEVVSVARLDASDILQLANPLFHGNAQFMTTLPAIIAGGSVVLFDRFSPTQFLERIRRYQITECNFLGAMMDWVWRQPARADDVDNSLRCIIACPTPPSIAAKVQARFGIEMITEVFGQTEICLPFMVPYGQERPGGAVGVAVSEYFEVRLVNQDTGEDVGVGEVGELWVREKAPGLLNAGYWGMPEEAEEALRDGWFHTGDGLRMDAGGWFYFTDRMKDTLRRRGENISSFEVEQALLEHPAVAECAVIAAPAEFEGGEDEVKAVVVLSGEADWPSIIQWAAERLPYFVVPRYWEAVEELPKTPSSKIQKAILRQEGVTPGTFDRVSAGVDVARTDLGRRR